MDRVPPAAPDDRARLIGAAGPMPRAWRIAARLRADPAAFAAPTDFATGAAVAMPEAGSIYALDPASATAWTCDVPYADLAGHPFAYARQADRAGVLARLPADALPARTDRPATGIFSIGRCGSTLLSRLLTAAGAQTLSELDAFTALGQTSRRWPSDPGVQARLTRLAEGAVAHAAAATCAGELVFKFRSQAMQAARAITGAGVRPVLLVRRFADWAASTARHFPADPPEGRIDATARGLEDMAALAGAPVVLDYDRLLSDPVGAVALCLGGPADPARHAAIRACLSRHSQSGTALERPRAEIRAQDVERAAELWSRRADPGALGRLGLAPDLTPLTRRI